MAIEDVPCLKSEDVDIKNIPHNKAVWTSCVNDFNDFNNQVMAIGNSFQLSLLCFFQVTHSILPKPPLSVIIILMANMI